MVSLYHQNRPTVRASPELSRVAALPARQADPDTGAALSQWLAKTPDVKLRTAQAEALIELVEIGGLFAPMRVGSGKTLVTLLAPTITEAARPVLLVPASLRDKTRLEFLEYSKHWHVRLPRIVSYQSLGREKQADLLFDLDADLLVLDEAHYVRNLDSAVTRRVERFILDKLPKVAVLSGTLITPWLMDFYHLLLWSLKSKAPVTLSPTEAKTWAKATDYDVPWMDRVDPGPLADLHPGGYHEFIRTRRGVVPTGGDDCEATIEITQWDADLPMDVIGLIKQAESGIRPDGEELDEAGIAECVCQLALGFYCVWDPPPPDWWLDPRREWNRYVREILEERRPGADSEGQIRSNLTDPEGQRLLADWLAVRDQFTPNPKPVWIDRDIWRSLEDYAESRDAILWTKYRAPGQISRLPYYGQSSEPPKVRKPVVLSIAAHGTGKNLQPWDTSIVAHPPASYDAWEQLIGRTHRPGQKASSIFVDIWAPTDYHRAVLRRVSEQAREASAASGFSQKLELAEWRREKWHHYHH